MSPDGRRVAVGVFQPVVWVGLHPHRLRQGPAGGVIRVEGRPVVHGEDALRPAGDHVEAGVRRDPVEPRPERASAFHPSEASPGPQERILEGVLGVVKRAEHPVAVSVKLGLVGLDEAAEGILVALAGRGEKLVLLENRCVERTHPHLTRPSPAAELIATAMNSPEGKQSYGERREAAP